MSDARLRALERRWQETGDPRDEAALLLARLRAGDLTRDRLEAAALVGHGPAQTALETGPPELTLFSPATREAVADPRAMLRRLGELSTEAIVRYGFAVAENRLARCPEALDWTRNVDQALRAWLAGGEAKAARSRAELLWDSLNDRIDLGATAQAREALFALAVTSLAVDLGQPLSSAASPLHLLAHEQPGDRQAGAQAVLAWALGRR